MDDLLIVEASCNGNKAAFGSLIDRYYKNVYRFAFQLTANQHDADEICQETFLKAFENIKKLKNRSCFKAWLFEIALNLSRKRYKQSAKFKQLENGSYGMEIGIDIRDSGPIEKLSNNEKIAIINQKLREMPEQLRTVTVLVHFEDLSQKEAAQIIGCSESSVSRHLELANEWLRNRLQNFISL